MTDLLVKFLLIFSFNTEFHNALEDENCVIQSELCFVGLSVVRQVIAWSSVQRSDFDVMLLLAFL